MFFKTQLSAIAEGLVSKRKAEQHLGGGKEWVAEAGTHFLILRPSFSPDITSVFLSNNDIGYYILLKWRQFSGEYITKENEHRFWLWYCATENSHLNHPKLKK